MCYCFLAISLKTLQDQLDFIMLSLRNDWMICAKKIKWNETIIRLGLSKYWSPIFTSVVANSLYSGVANQIARLLISNHCLKVYDKWDSVC